MYWVIILLILMKLSDPKHLNGSVFFMLGIKKREVYFYYTEYII